MDLQITDKALKEVACDALVVGAIRSKAEQNTNGVVLSKAAKEVDAVLGGLLSEICSGGEFRRSLGDMTTIYTMGKLTAKRVIVVGLGPQDTLNVQSLRRASAIATRNLQQTGAQQVALALFLDDVPVEEELAAQAQVEGALLGTYAFKKYLHSDDNGRGITQVWLVAAKASTASLELAMHKGSVLAEATNFARDLVNEPPKFIILRYQGASMSTDKGMALVGKGITFDSGGISLKPAERMDEMKGDMAGAAAVIGAMQAIASLKPAVNVTALIPTTENMPSGTAYHPGDILRIMNGKTIEIVNTDAEGRLVLADALSYASKEGLSPMIDVATLTGAVVVALGNTSAGLFSNDTELSDEIIAAGTVAGEKFWPMPMDAED